MYTALLLYLFAFSKVDLCFFMTFLITSKKLFASWTVTSLLLLVVVLRTKDFHIAPIPSTTLFPCDVAVNFLINFFLNLADSRCSKCTMYSFLNSELGPLDHIIFSETDSSFLITCSYKYSKKVP